MKNTITYETREVKKGYMRNLNKPLYIIRGENGSAEYAARGTNDSRVALFFALSRDIPSERLSDLLHMVIQDGKNDANIIADLFIMVFQTRHCRGGKGERDLFYFMIFKLAQIFPETVASLMDIVPHYGSFKDWFQLIEWSSKEQEENETAAQLNKNQSAFTPIKETILNLVCDQLRKDDAILSKGKPTTCISLLAKWTPREGKRMSSLAKELAAKLFPDSKVPRKEYRQLLSRLNKAINPVEVKMSSNEWDSINFSKQVTSLSLMKYRKAFLNETVNCMPPSSHEDETGNRYPNNKVRVACRKQLRETMLNQNVSRLKGKQLFPHEIVQKIMNDWSGKLSSLEKDIFAFQWDDIKNNVLQSLSEAKSKKEVEQGHGLSIDLGKTVSLVDVSGSMGGTPMEVAIALGILVSEIASPAYGNRCLTFSATPTWVKLDPSMSLDEKVKKMKQAPWGMNTNFEMAMERILQVAVEAKLSPEDIPDLIVFSDMQFDVARKESSHTTNWETHHKRIVRRFKEEGLKVCGKEWPAPHMIYWNLRGDTSGFPAQADTPGVSMLSGYSPSLMKLILNGEVMEEEESLEEGVEKSVKKDPLSLVRKALDSEDYDNVREVLYRSNEGVLNRYVQLEKKDDMEEEKSEEIKNDYVVLNPSNL